MNSQARDPFAPQPKPQLTISESECFFDEEENFLFWATPKLRAQSSFNKSITGSYQCLARFEFIIGDDSDIHVERWYKRAKEGDAKVVKKAPQGRSAPTRKKKVNKVPIQRSSK